VDLPLGVQELKFVTEKGEWITSNAYPTVLRGDIENNAIAVPSTFQQVVRCAWWFGELIASSFKALVNTCMDAAVSIASATVAIVAVSSTVMKPIVAPVVASMLKKF